MLLIFKALLLGLSTGIFCLSYCLPVIIPLVLSQERKTIQSFWLVAKFAVGRLAGYLLFGALVGYLGFKIESRFVHNLIWLALVILAILLILYAFGFFKQRWSFCVYFRKISPPWLFGFLVGLNICPPFLLALTYGFNLANVWQGIIFFLSFFVGTSVFLLPAGFLSALTHRVLLRQIAQVAAFLSGIIYLIYGVANLIKFYG